MTSVQHLIDVARAEVGVREDGHNHQKYGKWWGWDGVAWCDIFTSWVFSQAGCVRPAEQIPGRPGGASVNFTAAYWKAKGLWRPSTQAQPGDLICWDWTGTESGRNWNQTHIGIVVGVNGRTLTTVEGNVGTPQGVHQRTWTAGGNQIWGTCNMQAHIAAGASDPQPQPTPQLPSTPAGVPRYDFPLVLTSPIQHDHHVLIWQQQMVRRGWKIDADGWYGPASMAACRAFQADKRLEVDGVVGPRTWVATWKSPVT